MIQEHPGIQPEIAIAAIPLDERVRVPQAPLVLRVRRAGVLSRHLHPSAATGYVIKGAWRYLEPDWVAREGSFVLEPPGEIHTLVVDETAGGTEMITLFSIQGAMVYLEEAGKQVGTRRVYEDRDVQRAYEAVGLGGGFVEQFVQ